MNKISARRIVDVVNLGRMGFMAAYDVQMRLARGHLDELSGKPHVHGENTILLVEHTPVYTVGIRTKGYSEEDETRLKATGAEFYKTNRGGLITFHGPGQLVAYPILNLQHFNPSMKWYVSQLEKTLLSTLRKFGLTGRTTDQTGVWVDDRKIASIGLHGSRYVTTHGVAINCNVDLSWFDHITPCGLEGVKMSSLTRELEHDVPYQDAIRPFLRSFQENFDCEMKYTMLEERDFKSYAAPRQTSSSPVETRGANRELGMRHMSTLATPTSSRSSTPTSSRSSNQSFQSDEEDSDDASKGPMW